jgi:hypothetical protein
MKEPQVKPSCLALFFSSQNKFYLNKALNVLRNVKAGREKKNK